ncbi:N-acetylmuramoyl-L-alanine amidase [Oscillospiraceae bacterium MB24-C1]|nr:N-acetylmuramoyl-L-alanine amidase [Oscillospiraceae bacterium MB24-C1]
MARRTKKRKKHMAIFLCMTLVLLTAATGVLALLANDTDSPLFVNKAAFGGGRQSSSEVQSEATSASSAPDAQPIAQKVFPDELRAVTLKPGVDFPVTGSDEEMAAGIDKAINAALDLTMNAVVIDTLDNDGNVLYPSSFLPCLTCEEERLDPLLSAITQAREAGLYVYTTYYITDVAFNDKIAVLGKATSSLIDGVTSDIASFTSRYQPDGVLLDGYYNVQSKRSYSNYLALGGGIGFEAYMRAVPETLLTLVRDELGRTSPSVAIGLLSEAVWANDYENENGSATKAVFSAFADGNADTLKFMETGLADFVAVKAYGSIDDAQTPYQVVASWWANVADKTGTPLYIMHAADRAVTEAVGWTEYDQLARQVIEARELPGYDGSIFNSLTRLVENPKDCASKLVGYFGGSVKPEHIMQDLELTKPSKTTFTSFDPTVLFTGHTDPNTDATINGVEITTDENGYFQLEMPLTEGENVFKINHKGKTVTYNITRITEVVKQVSPGSGTLNVDGSTKLTIDAVAYAEAKVYAVIGGTTVMLKQNDDRQQDDEYRDTAYARFTGVYTVPDAKTEEQNLGAVTVYGEWNGLTKSKSGAKIIVNKRVLPSDGTPVVVTADLAETFRGDTVSQYSEPSYFPLPKGALDYVVGEELKYTFTNKNKLQTYRFYRLQSGLRVFADDIATVSVSSAAVGNQITGCTVKSDSRYTKIILATRQQVSYVATYAADKLTFKFNYTNSLPDSMKLSKNPLFSAVDFSGDTMTLTLRSSGKFMGMYPYYDNDGNLVLRFNNPPIVTNSNLSGAKIVIDPGHGGSDVGALGYLSAYPERAVNYAITSKLVSILKNRGATVMVTNSNQYNYSSLEQRVAGTAAADPHLFISVHSNSSAYNASAAGTEAYYFNYWSSGLAQFASANVASALSTNNRGQKFGYYYVTRSMQYPAILVETGFMSNQTEYHKLINEGYQSNIANGLANAIGSYLKYMGSAGSLTGTETSGQSVGDAGKNNSADSNLANNGIGTGQSAAEGSDVEFYLSETELTLSPGEEVEITAQWNTDDKFTVVWAASGDGATADLGSFENKLVVTAKAEGEMKLIATVQGRSDLKAECTLVVE